MKKVSLIALPLLVFLLLAGCSGEPRAKEVRLVAKDIAWSLEEIEAKPGQKIRLTLVNDGALDHDFVIEELGIDVLLNPGDEEVVEFIVTQSGTLDYICSVPGHEEAGMVGEIVIRP